MRSGIVLGTAIFVSCAATTAHAEHAAEPLPKLSLGTFGSGFLQIDPSIGSVHPSTIIFVDSAIPISQRCAAIFALGSGSLWEHGHSLFVAVGHGGARFKLSEHNALELTGFFETAYSPKTSMSKEVSPGIELSFVRFLTHTWYLTGGIGGSYSVVKVGNEPEETHSGLRIIATAGLGAHLIDLY